MRAVVSSIEVERNIHMKRVALKATLLAGDARILAGWRRSGAADYKQNPFTLVS